MLISIYFDRLHRHSYPICRLYYLFWDRNATIMQFGLAVLFLIDLPLSLVPSLVSIVELLLRTAFDHSATCNVQAHASVVVAFLRLIASVVIQYSLIILIIHLQMPTCESKLSSAVSHRIAMHVVVTKIKQMHCVWRRGSHKRKISYIISTINTI